MASSTAPLTRAELAQLLEGLPTFHPKEGHYEGLDPVQVVKFFLFTGIHPAVLADKDKWWLHVEGPQHLVWRRPKTKRTIKVPADPEIRKWMKEFLDQLPPRTVMTYNRLVHDVGAHVGLPELSPRTLRHTFLRLLADRTRDIDDVMRYGGCSLAVAVGYVRTADSERDRAILEGGLLSAQV